MPPLTTHAIKLLYTPQDYDNKLLFQTWQHLIRADYRTFLETCDDPAPLPTNPMTLTRLLNLDSEPPLAQPYYSGCNITAQFHVISKNTLNNNLYDRLLILSIKLPDSSYPNLIEEQVQEDRLPNSYQYDTDTNSGRSIRPKGCIWQTHRLKSLAIKLIPTLLDSVILPTPTETLRFRASTDSGVSWTVPQHFFPDDHGFISIERNVSFQLDTSQDLINTELDDTLDQVTGNFLPNIASLGKPTRQHENYGDGTRDFPDVEHYPYETTPGARARLIQDAHIPRHLRSTLTPHTQSPNRTPEQVRLIAMVQHNICPEPLVEEPAPAPADPGTIAIPQPSATPLMSPAIFANERPPETPQTTGPPSQSTPDAVISTDSSSASTTSAAASSDLNISLGPGVSPLTKKMTALADLPLAFGPVMILSPPVCQQDIGDSVVLDEHIRLQSEDKAPPQLEEFNRFVYTLAEYYNEDPIHIKGLEEVLTPLISQDHVTKHFNVRIDLLTNQNVRIIDILRKDHASKKTSIFDVNNPILKTILKRFVRNY